MRELVSGAMITGYLVAALFFLRFWTRTRDRLFAWFSAAFLILALTRIGLSLTSEQLEYSHFYLGRLLAFGLIIVAIWTKNASSRRT